MITKIELKKQLKILGIKVEGNRIRKKDLQKILAETNPLVKTLEDMLLLRDEFEKIHVEWGNLGKGIKQPEDNRKRIKTDAAFKAGYKMLDDIIYAIDDSLPESKIKFP
jgi:hypothetical protein